MSISPGQLRPLGVTEILDAGIKVYRSKFATMLVAVAVVTVPVQVFSILVRLSLPGSPSGTTASSSDAWASVAALLLIFVATMVSSTLAHAACFKAVSDTYLGADTTWRESLRFGYQRLGSLLWLTLVHAVVLVLAFAACLVPGIWLYAAWSVAVPVLLTEGARGFKALGRSFDLVRGRWWPIAGLLFLANLMVTAISTGFALVALPLLLAGRGGDFLTTLANGLVQGAASVITIPFLSAVVAVLYFDLRVRKEGFDLQLMAQRIGDPSAAVPAFMPWSYPQPGAGGGWAPPPPPAPPVPGPPSPQPSGPPPAPPWR